MDMDKLVSLCKRRGFLFQSSEIYGGLNGFWDYGPLGVELKRNIKEAWWRDMVTGHDELADAARRAVDLRDGRPRLHDHHAPAGLEVLGALRPVLRHDGRLPGVEEALSLRPGPRPLGRVSRARRCSSRRSPRTRPRTLQQRALKSSSSCGRRTRTRSRGTATSMSLAKVDDLSQGARPRGQRARHAHRAARVQPDVQDDRRRAGHRGRRGVPPPRNGPGHLRQLQERARQHARQDAVRHRPDGQELPQRDHAAEFHVPLARVRADGDRVLLPSERRRGSGTSTGATGG